MTKFETIEGVSVRRGGIGAKVGAIWSGNAARSQGLFARLFPAPVVSRPVNPYLAAGLELLGYAGLLGIGRMSAGDVKGGLRVMMVWLAAVTVFFTSFSFLGLIAVLLAIPTIGFSLLMFAISVGPPLIYFVIVPAVSAFRLFIQLRQQ